MYARLSSLGNSFRGRISSKSSSNNGDDKKTEQELIQRTQSIIDNNIQQRGKLHLTYNAIKEKLITEFGVTLYEQCKPFVQDLIKQAAPKESRNDSKNATRTGQEGRRPITVNGGDKRSTGPINARRLTTSSVIYKASTTDQSTMRHDLNGAMSRTLTEDQVNQLAQALHSSWPRKASEVKKKSAMQHMDIERGGIMSQKEGKDGMDLKLALASARKDPEVQQQLKQLHSTKHHSNNNNNTNNNSNSGVPTYNGATQGRLQQQYAPRRRASTLATPGQDIQSNLKLMRHNVIHNNVRFTNMQQQQQQGVMHNKINSSNSSSNSNNNSTSRRRTSSTSESRRRSLNQLKQSFEHHEQSQFDATGNFVVPRSPSDNNNYMSNDNSKRTKFASFEDGDANPRMKYNNVGSYAMHSISERAQRLSQISFLKRKGILSDSQRALAKDLLLQGDQGIMYALKISEQNPLKLVSYISLRMGQPGVEALSHLQSMRKKQQKQFSVAKSEEDEEVKKQRGRPKRRRSSKEGTVGTREAPRIWSAEEDKLLLTAVEEYGPKNWKSIAMRVPNRNHVQCLQRYKKVLKPGLKRGGWTLQEDSLLTSLYFDEMKRQNIVVDDLKRPTHVRAAWLKNWTLLANQIEGRTAKQCRERWCNHLDPSIVKGNWTKVEDELIIQKQKELGNKWSKISKLLLGRTENAVKVRWKALDRASKKANALAKLGSKVAGGNLKDLKSSKEKSSKGRSSAQMLPDKSIVRVRSNGPGMDNSLEGIMNMVIGTDPLINNSLEEGNGTNINNSLEDDITREYSNMLFNDADDMQMSLDLDGSLDLQHQQHRTNSGGDLDTTSTTTVGAGATTSGSSSVTSNKVHHARGSGKNGSWTDLMMFDDDSFDVADVFAED